MQSAITIAKPLHVGLIDLFLNAIPKKEGLVDTVLPEPNLLMRAKLLIGLLTPIQVGAETDNGETEIASVNIQAIMRRSTGFWGSSISGRFNELNRALRELYTCLAGLDDNERKSITPQLSCYINNLKTYEALSDGNKKEIVSQLEKYLSADIGSSSSETKRPPTVATYTFVEENLPPVEPSSLTSSSVTQEPLVTTETSAVIEEQGKKEDVPALPKLAQEFDEDKELDKDGASPEVSLSPRYA